MSVSVSVSESEYRVGDLSSFGAEPHDSGFLLRLKTEESQALGCYKYQGEYLRLQVLSVVGSRATPCLTGKRHEILTGELPVVVEIKRSLLSGREPLDTPPTFARRKP